MCSFYVIVLGNFTGGRMHRFLFSSNRSVSCGSFSRKRAEHIVELVIYPLPFVCFNGKKIVDETVSYTRSKAALLIKKAYGHPTLEFNRYEIDIVDFDQL